MGEEEERHDLGPTDSPWEKPESSGPEVDQEELHRRCSSERETMTPRETADCAGDALAEEYEREEDGGS